MIKKIIVFLVFFLVGGIAIVERTTWLKNSVGAYFHDVFEQTFDCQMTYRVESVSLFRLSLTLADVTVKPRTDARWQWHADRYITKLSWRDLLTAGMLAMQVNLENMTAHSRMIDNTPAIFDHVHRLILGPSLRVAMLVKNLVIHHATLSVSDADHPSAVFISFDITTGRFAHHMSVYGVIHDAHATYGDRALLTSAQGTIQMQSDENAGLPGLTGSISCAATTPLLPSVTNVVGTWEHDHGSLKLTTHNGLVDINACTFEKTAQGFMINAQAHAALPALGGLLARTMPRGLEGNVALDVQAQITKTGLQDINAHAQLIDVRYGVIALGSGAIDGIQNGQQLTGALSVDGLIPVTGTYTFDMSTHALSGEVKTARDWIVPLTNWRIDKALLLKFFYDPVHAWRVMHTGMLSNMLTDARVTSTAEGTCDGASVHMSGAIDERTWKLNAELSPVHRRVCISLDAHETPVLTVKQMVDNPTSFLCTCDVVLLKECAQLAGYQVHGQGMVELVGTLHDNMLTSTLALVDGTIQLPKLYNCISGFNAVVIADLKAKKIDFSDMRCQFHQGALVCDHAEVSFDDRYQVVRAQVPLIFDSWLFATAGEFSAELSGNLLYAQKDGEMPSIIGAIAFDHAKVRENIFSEGFLSRIRGSIGSLQPSAIPEVSCSLDLSTHTPFHVVTPFLETDAQVKLHVANRVAAPTLSGSIELTGGHLAFPYKPLFIRKGALYFMPGNSLDPMIELNAQNTIKSHDVRLQVTGPLSAPSCMLDASPALREEQIASLLLVGTPEASLTSMAPALVMTNITSLLVDNIQSSQTLNRYLGPLIKSLKNVRVIPRFSDQSARGGIRTAVEVDVNDRWRALIQRNLSLTEDTRFEVEYRVSDEVSLKGTRNERGDVSGEVEMHYGF